MKSLYKPTERPLRTLYEVAITITGIVVLGWWFLPFALLLLIDIEVEFAPKS